MGGRERTRSLSFVRPIGSDRIWVAGVPGRRAGTLAQSGDGSRVAGRVAKRDADRGLRKALENASRCIEQMVGGREN
eukprot:1181567-Prorocentrum_minimum.AAC.3